MLRDRTALEALKQRTADTHREVEHVLDLLDPALDARRLGAVVARFHAFWQVAEAGVDAWSTGPDTSAAALMARLDWPRRRRAALLAADHATLLATVSPAAGSAVVPPAAAVPTAAVALPGVDVLATGPFGPTGPRDAAEVLGWLYVSEGATLGGAVLARHLGPRGLPVGSFSPYAEGPGPMWLSFGATLQDWTGGDAARVDAVAAAADASFAALAAWVRPLRAGAAA